MASLDVSNVMVVGFPVDTTITTVGGTHILVAGNWLGVPMADRRAEFMTVSPAGPAYCRYDDGLGDGQKADIQVMTIDEIKTSS